jgi:hypothetical protein
VPTIKNLFKKDKKSIDFTGLPEHKEKKVSQGISHLPVKWVFCCVCNKSMREREGWTPPEEREYCYIQLGFNEGLEELEREELDEERELDEYCSWDPGKSGVICNECYPRAMDQLRAILPYLNL